MKNNIIKDDREIGIKAEIPTDSYVDAPAITAPMEDHNLSTEPDQMNTETPIDLSDPIIEPMMIADEPMIEPAADGSSIQTEITAFLDNVAATTTELFNNNRQLFITLGWIVLIIFSAKVVFATLGIIDDIPLVTPLIKLVGLVSVVRFAWRYLIREHDRQELIEIIDRTKVEVLGDR
jgi:CAAD domains of cyanobacterial aminoacyl-tRNA synthetase